MDRIIRDLPLLSLMEDSCGLPSPIIVGVPPAVSFGMYLYEVRSLLRN